LKTGLSDRIEASLRQGSGLAISAGGEQLSWEELAVRIQSICAGLSHLGVPRGATVAVPGRSTIACAVLVLALVYGGRCARIVNPHGSAATTLQVARSKGGDAILLPEHDPILVEARRSDNIIAAAEDGAVRRCGPTEAKRVCDTRSDGIIISTSGTTGDPKPFHLSHAVLSRAIGDIESINEGFGDRRREDGSWRPLIQYSPLAHIGGALTLLRAAAQGRSTVILGKFDPESWAQTVEKFNLATTGLPPSMMRMVVHAQIAPERLESLVSVWSGTAPLRSEDREAFTATYGIPVLGNYGATEFCGAIAAWSLADHAKYYDSKPDAVGRLIPGVAEARVRAEDGEVLDQEGTVGALEFRIKRVSDEWLETGDLGSIDGDGFLTLHGRSDDAIVRGGFKLSPTLISQALREHPGVRDAVVIGLDDERLGQVPVAAIELENGSQPEIGELRQFLRGKLPPYFVPTQLQIVEALPRNAAMKLDRRAIGALFES